MASSTEHNPAASDPAVLYWDWERTKILNRPPGLEPPGKIMKYPPGLMPPEQPPWDKPHFQRPEQPRAGTLKRTNAFSEGEKSQTVASHDQKSAFIGTAPDDDNSPGPLKANVDFPETLYSKANRRMIEDIGNKFIESIQKLDKGKPGELVDFNSILENHWNELAEFYSERVSTVRTLEKRTESTILSMKGGLSTNPSPQLPAYMISRLEEYKAPLSPLVKPKGMSFASSLESEASHLVPEDPAFGSSKYGKTGAKYSVTPGRFSEMNGIKEAHRVTGEEPKFASLDKNDKATPSTPTVGACSEGKVAETVSSISVKVKEPAEVILYENPMEGTHEDLEIVPGILKEAVCVELPTNSEDLAKNSGFTKLDMTVKDNIKRKDIISTIGGIGQNKDEVTQGPNTDVTGNADPCEIARVVNAQPVANFSAEAGLKAFLKTKQFKGTEDANINSPNKTDIQTDHNTSRVESKPTENKAVRSEKANVDSNDVAKDGKGRKILILAGPESDLEAIIETNPGKFHPFMEDQMDSNEEYIYRSDSNEVSNKISNLDIDNEDLDLLDSGDISSEADCSVDMIFGAISCAPEEITFKEAGVTPPLTSHTVVPTQNKTEASMTEKEDSPLTLIVAEPVPPDSNDSSPVFSDSSLSFGSTKGELERLQIEFNDHLEKVERIEGSFIEKWIDEFGIKREKKVGEPGEMMTESPSENEEEGSGDDQGDGTIEFEHDHEGDGNQEDDEIGGVRGILARLHEVEKEEAEAGCVDKTGIDGSKNGTTDPSSIQSESSTNNEEDDDGDDDDQGGESKSEEVDLNIVKQFVYGKELSVVDEEEEEEDGGEEDGREEIKEDPSDDSEDCEDCEDNSDGSKDCEDCRDDNEDVGEEGSESEGPIISIEKIDEGNKSDDKKEGVDTKGDIASLGEELKLEDETEEGPKGNTKETNTKAKMKA